MLHGLMLNLLHTLFRIFWWVPCVAIGAIIFKMWTRYKKRGLN